MQTTRFKQSNWIFVLRTSRDFFPVALPRNLFALLTCTDHGALSLAFKQDKLGMIKSKGNQIYIYIYKQNIKNKTKNNQTKNNREQGYPLIKFEVSSIDNEFFE